MPIYVFQCQKCGTITEEFRPVKERKKWGPPCCGGRMKRDLGLEGCNTDCNEWFHPILSDRMGVNPDQVAQHRKMFPNIPMNDGGQVVVSSGAEEKRINKELANTFGAR